MTDQTAMQMGLGEPAIEKPFTLHARIAGWLSNKKRQIVESFRTRRWLRMTVVLLLLGGVFASGAAFNRTITVPGKSPTVTCLPVPTPGKAQKTGGK